MHIAIESFKRVGYVKGKEVNKKDEKLGKMVIQLNKSDYLTWRRNARIKQTAETKLLKYRSIEI
jgi:hypothetical protein